jgi:hypothetical protein
MKASASSYGTGAWLTRHSISSDWSTRLQMGRALRGGKRCATARSFA